MLMKQYVTRMDDGNDRDPFLICNAAPKRFIRLRDYLSGITQEELSAPALKIKPDEPEQFWQCLSSGWIDTPLPAEILDAMKGNDSDWKLIRCVLTYSSAVFTLVNPEVYAQGIRVERGDKLYNTFAADMKKGIVHVYIDRDNLGLGCLGLKVKVKRLKKGKLKTYQEYRLEIHYSDHYATFTEYNKKLTRISEIDHSDEDDKDNYMSTVYVTEFYL